MVPVIAVGAGEVAPQAQIDRDPKAGVEPVDLPDKPQHLPFFLFRVRNDHPERKQLVHHPLRDAARLDLGEDPFGKQGHGPLAAGKKQELARCFRDRVGEQVAGWIHGFCPGEWL